MSLPTFPSLFLPPLLTAAAVSFLATPLAIRLAWHFGLVDNPKFHKHPKVVHTYPVPRGGGLPIFLALVAGASLFLVRDIRIAGVVLGATFALAIGVADDKWGLNPYLRIAANLATALPLVIFGVGLSYITNPFGGILNFEPWLSAIFTLVWVGGMMNFLGIGAGGIEGQHPGVVAIAATTLGLLAARYINDPSQWPVVILAGITAGAYLGFLPWNFYPQKIMPGYSGKSLAGYLLAVIAILAVAKVQTLLMVLAIPIADAGWAIVRRILSGKSPVWGDRGHLHHHLLDLGWGKRRIAVFYWTITAISGILALWLNSKQKFYTLAAAFLIIGTIILWLSYWTSSKVSGRDNGLKT